MIDALLAKKFIERITQYTEYNVNIMDEKGIIIASKNTSRIGTFHEVAPVSYTHLDVYKRQL